MLEYLHVQGLALIDDVRLTFGPGMNVLTGETGAGKSIIVDALVLLRGGRSRPDLVRAGADRVVVEGQFAIPEGLCADLRARLSEADLPDIDEDGLLVRREVAASTGRSRCFVQGRLVPKATLSAVVAPLIDVCSQHEHHVLARADGQRDLLDRFAGAAALRRKTAAAYETYRAAREALTALAAEAADGPERLAFLHHQIETIEKAAPAPGEEEALRERLALLSEAHRFAGLAHDTAEVLYEGDGAVVERIGALLRRARELPQGGNCTAELIERLEQVEAACEEAAEAARRMTDALELDPEGLEALQARLFELEDLRRRFGGGLASLAERLEGLRTEAARLENLEAERKAQAQRLADARKGLWEAARKLHARRAAAAPRFARAVAKALSELHMAGARVEVDVRLREDDVPGPAGADRVAFAFSANPGEPLAPLARVASGGELSRLLLAVKSVERTGTGVATYVFDEVDAGVGGAVAEAIGRKLVRAAEGHQVLCITHLPQIAALAHVHHRVAKTRRGRRTVTTVDRIDGEARVEEIARMLAGARVTDSARRHARTLMAEAGRLHGTAGNPSGGPRRRDAGTAAR